MTLKVIGTGEVIEQVFWLDTRSRTVGVKLRQPANGGERCDHVMLASIEVEKKGKTSRTDVENAVGDRAQVVLRDE